MTLFIVGRIPLHWLQVELFMLPPEPQFHLKECVVNNFTYINVQTKSQLSSFSHS